MKKLLALLILSSFALFSGCKDEETTVIAPAPDYNVMGTITGKVRDDCTGKPIAGVIVSVGVNGAVYSASTDISGSFSFANVPAGEYQTIDGSHVYSGEYTMTYSFVNVNGTIADTAQRYRDYYYKDAVITFTNPDSSKFIGLVAEVFCTPSKMGTTIKGVVVDANEQPVAGARVELTDPIYSGSAYKQTTTDVNGKYAFTYVENSGTVSIRALSQDGKMEGYSNSMNLGCRGNIELRPQVSAERIVIKPQDNINPFVIKTTPENSADVSPNGLAVTYTFSEPIKQTPYTSVVKGAINYRTMMNDLVFKYMGLKKAADLQVAASWNADFTELTFTPVEITGSAKYSVDISMILPYLTDMAGHACLNNTSLTGDYENLTFTTNGNSPVPSAPALVRRTGGAYAKINYNGGIVGLEWNEDPNAPYHNVYQKAGSGPYVLIKEKITARYSEVSVGGLWAGLNDSPQKAISVSYKITGVNADLVEGPASNVIVISDEVKPLATAISILNIGGNTYTTTVNFSEYMNMASAQTPANYSFSNLGAGITYTITNVEYLEDASTVKTVVTFTTNGAIAVDSHLTVANLSDLAGNVIVSTQLF